MRKTLRPYQVKAIEDLREKFAQGNKRIILVGACGFGKTEVAIEMAARAIERRPNKRVLFCCARVTLIKQAARRFQEAGLDCGVLQAKNTIGTWKNIVICSIDTIASRGAPEDVGLLIIDEAHGAAGSKAYRKLIADCKCHVIGVTATPHSRGLGKHYEEIGGALFQDIAKSATAKDLIEQGYLVDADFYGPSTPDLSKVNIVAGDYQEDQLGEVMDKPRLVADIVDTWLKYANGKRTICSAVNISHSKHIVERFRSIGVNAVHIDCYMQEEEKDEIIGRARAGDITVLSQVSLLSEGVDIPELECLIYAKPTKSLIRWRQTAGRVFRPSKGKERAIVLDHSGTCSRLGYPTDDIDLVLDDGKPKSTKKADKKEKLPEPCKSCSFLKVTHKCPQCGFAPKTQAKGIEHADGELQLLKGKKKKEFTTAEKEHIYAQLLGYAKKKGYKDGWSYHKCKERCGTYPSRKVAPIEPGPEILGWIQHMNIKNAKRKEREAANV